jgi:DNA (cytosine-5)-methyltransferase 1
VTAGTSKRPGGNGHALGIVEAAISPFIAGAGGPKYSAKPRSVENPMHTLCNTNHSCVIAPVIARQFGNSIGHRADEPGATVTAGGGGKSQLVSATMIQMGYGERKGRLRGFSRSGSRLVLSLLVAISSPWWRQTSLNILAGIIQDLAWHWMNQFIRSPLRITMRWLHPVKMRGTNLGQPTDTPFADRNGGWPALW